MNFTKEQQEFLHKFQTLTFDKRLTEGTPSQKADVLRNILVQLDYYKKTGLSDEQTCDSVKSEYEEKYASVVDSLDEQTGLNNFAEGALALCSGNKNESQSWKTSLSSDRIKNLKCIQKLREANKRSTDKLLPAEKRNQPLPFCLNKENICKPTNAGTSNSNMKPPSNIHHQTAFAQPGHPQSGYGGSGNKVMNLYDTGGTVPPVVERNYGRGTSLQNSNRVNQKPLFSNTTQSNNYSDQFRGRGTNFGSGSRHRGDAMKRPYGDNEENLDMEQDRPSTGMNVFKTAKEQLSIDQQKKYSGGRGGSLSTSSYGTQKKSLGTRRGPASRFVPPVMNREDDGNEASNTITRAVLKTGGSGGSSGNQDFNMEGLDQEKLKGIEPKMVELIMNEIMDNGPQLTWDDIAGLEFAKKTIKEIVVWPMLRPDIFTGLRGPPKGLLLFGPPGTGKTLIGKCIASQSKSTFFCISASSLTSKWVGEGEKMVRALFAVARSQQPAVVFIDEIDSLLTQRTDGENEASRRIKTEFLVQLDGAGTSSDERILIIGATNRPQEIDEAARRRFVKRLYIPLPELGARKTIILNLLKQQSYHLTEEQLDAICSRTDGFSGADMATLCREAALGPIRDMSFGDIENISADQVRPITFTDFEDALMNVKPSVSDKDLDAYLDWHNTFGTGSR